MRNLIVLVLLLGLLFASGAQAASYERFDAVVVDPILITTGQVHSYSGPNLEPSADLYGADLSYASLYYAALSDTNLFGADLSYADLSDAALSDANLFDADLSAADLSDANLFGADLSYASLSGADLTNADLSDANLTNTDLSDADLGAYYLGTTTGSAFYDAETDFTNAYSGAYGTSARFDPVAAGWTFVPEPNGMLLGIAALACVGLLARRRAH